MRPCLTELGLCSRLILKHYNDGAVTIRPPDRVPVNYPFHLGDLALDGHTL
jgi:hypothetical protein